MNPNKSLIMWCLVVILLGSSINKMDAQSDNSAILASAEELCDELNPSIEITKEDNNVVSITGLMRNKDVVNREVKYKMRTKRQGKSGKTDTSQGSTISIKSHEKETLSRQKISMSAGDKCKVTLRIYENEELVCEVLLEYKAE